MRKKTTVQDPYNFETSGGTHNAFFLCLQNLARTLTSKINVNYELKRYNLKGCYKRTFSASSINLIHWSRRLSTSSTSLRGKHRLYSLEKKEKGYVIWWFSLSGPLQQHIRRVWSSLGLYFCEPLLSQNTHWFDQTSLICHRSVPREARLGIYRTQIRPSDHDIIAISSQWLDIAWYQDS